MDEALSHAVPLALHVGAQLCQQLVTLLPSASLLLLEVEQDAVVLPPARPPPAFCPWKNFSQSISLIREMRDYSNKGKQSNKTKQE